MADQAAIFDANNPSSPLSIPASQTALLLMDFHTFLISTMPQEGLDAITTAASLRKWARDQNMPIIHCRIDVQGKTPPQLKMAARCPSIRDAVRKAGPSAAGEVPDLEPLGDEYVFWRPLGYVSGLSSFGLTAFLQHHGVKSLVLSGVATSGCIIDTAKAAAEAGFVVSVVEDACADRTVEMHDLVVKKILPRQCHVATKDAFVAAWK